MLFLAGTACDVCSMWPAPTPAADCPEFNDGWVEGSASGWLCADSFAEWQVKAELVDGATLSPLADAHVLVTLARAGMALDYAPDDASTDATGRLDVAHEVVLIGPCAPVGCPGPCMSYSPLGDPPDEIQLMVDTPDSRRGTVSVALRAEHFGEYVDYYCVHFVGFIELGQVPLSLSADQ